MASKNLTEKAQKLGIPTIKFQLDVEKTQTAKLDTARLGATAVSQMIVSTASIWQQKGRGSTKS